MPSWSDLGMGAVDTSLAALTGGASLAVPGLRPGNAPPSYSGINNFVSQNLMGNVDPNVLKNLLGQVQGPNAGAAQIAGLPQYQSTMQGLSQQYGNTNVDLGAATQGATQQGQQLGNYFTNVATGQGETAADQMLRNAQGAAGRQLQSGVVSAQGQSPALALRQLLNSQSALAGDIAGQSAQQKLQEQEQYGQLAQQNQQAQFQQQFQQAQQGFQNSMARLNAQRDIAQGLFDASARQTSYNMQADSNRMAFQQFMFQQQSQIATDQARQNAALAQLLIKGGLTAGGAALGGGMGASAGASMGNNMFAGDMSGGAPSYGGSPIGTGSTDLGMMNGGGAMGGEVA